MSISKELLEKAKVATSAKELGEIAKENSYILTEEQTNDFFEKLQHKSGEVADEELENVAGGRCGNGNGEKGLLCECGGNITTAEIATLNPHGGYNYTMGYACDKCGDRYRFKNNV